MDFSPDSQPDDAREDLLLMQRVSRDDEAAFCALVGKFQQPILNFFARLGSAAHAEDLAQETFVRLWKSRARYRPSAKLSTFLFTIARHVWQDHIRGTNRFRLFSERYRREIPPSTDGGLPRLHRDMDIQAALSRLSPKLREVLVLAVCQELPYADVARILSIPVGTVKSRVFNALSTLERLFHEE